MRARAAVAGFTLVEVVVALAVLSLVLLATVTALRTFANTGNSVDRLTARLDQVRTVSGFLRSSLEAAVTGDMSTGGLTLGGANEQPAYFRGGENYVEWKTAVLFGESYGGVFLVRVAREGDDLVLRWREPAAQARNERWDKAPSRPLLVGVEDFRVSYREAYRGEWVDEWKARGGPPALVRFHIGAAGRYWPELIAQVQR